MYDVIVCAMAMDTNVVPRRCALRFRPPTLVLLYLDPSSGKQRRRSMPLRCIGKDTSIEVFANSLQSHPRHSQYFQAIPTQQLCLLLRRVRDTCVENETDALEIAACTTAQPTSTGTLQQFVNTTTASEGGNNRDLKQPVHNPVTYLHNVSEDNETELQQFTKERKGTGDVQGNTGVQTITSLTVDSHSGGLLHGLPPLTETQLVTDMAKVSGFVLDDKLGPVVKEQASVQLNTHSDEASSSKEQVFLLPSSVQPAATFSTHLPKYNSDFSSENVEDCEAGLDAMDVSLSFKVEGISSGGDDGGISEEEREPVRNQLNLAIPEIVTGESSEASRNNEHSLCEEILPQMKMDNTFETNRVQPGEEGWLYDKEQAFGPACMECSWDSDSSSIQEF